MLGSEADAPLRHSRSDGGSVPVPAHDVASVQTLLWPIVMAIFVVAMTANSLRIRVRTSCWRVRSCCYQRFRPFPVSTTRPAPRIRENSMIRCSRASKRMPCWSGSRCREQLLSNVAPPERHYESMCYERALCFAGYGCNLGAHAATTNS